MDRDEQEEQAENPSDIEPRFFRTPSVDLIRSPSTSSTGAARKSSADKNANRRPSMDLSIRKRITKQAASPERNSPPGRDPEVTSGLLSHDVELGEDARPYEVARSDEGLRDVRPNDQEIVRFGGPYTLQDFKDDLHGLCTLKTLQRKLPITGWLPKYSRLDLVGDLLAGLTVGLTVVPQCLAYAQIADIKLEYGLNSAYMGCFLYALLGTSKDVTVGPTAILSLLTGAFIRRGNGTEGQWAILLCFFVGCFQLLMGFLRLGFLINFISTPVVSGFTQAAVVVIILSQIKNMMGLKFGSAKDNVLQTLHGYWTKLPQTNGWDVLMGCVCITLLLLMREMKMPAWKAPANGSHQHPPKWWSVLKETIRLVSVSRYAIVVVFGTILQYVLEHYDIKVFSATGKVDAGISAPQPPNFNVDGLSFGEILSEFGSGLVMVPLLGTMESIAVAKTFAHKFRYNIDTTQEFLALGMANLVSSFFGSYPVTGAFTRSALNAESGVRTPMGCVITGTFVVISILSLGPLFQFIPKAALAAVIICACLTMFDFQIFKELWYIRKSELFVLVLTMACCLFLRIEFGLLIGLTTSLLMLIYPMARPAVIVTHRRREFNTQTQRLDDLKVNVIPQGAIFFPAAEYLKEIFNDALFTAPVLARSGPRESMAANGGALVPSGSNEEETRQSLPPIVFDGIHLTSSDYSTLRALRSVYMNCKANHRDIIFINTADEILDLIIPTRKKTVEVKRNVEPSAPPIPLNNMRPT